MPETTNLKLYKKDPIAEKKTTFNIETMLNENWDKIDQAFGGIENALENIITYKDVNNLSHITDGLITWSLQQTTDQTRNQVSVYKATKDISNFDYLACLHDSTVIYNNAGKDGTSINLTGLTSGTQYWVKVFIVYVIGGKPYYSNGVTVTFTYSQPVVVTEFFNAGNEYSAITGGWVEGYMSGNSATSKSNGNLYLTTQYISGSAISTFVTNNKINMSNLKTLKISWTKLTGLDTDCYSNFGASNGKTDINFNAGYTAKIGKFQTSTSSCDVSKLSGDYYLKILNQATSAQNTQLIVHRVWGEGFDTSLKPNVTNLTSTQSGAVSWTLPTDNAPYRTGIEVFKATKDISNFDHATCVADGAVTKTTLGKDVTNTTLSGLVASTQYWVKVFVKYTVDGVDSYSSGVSTSFTYVPPVVITEFYNAGNEFTAVTGGWANKYSSNTASEFVKTPTNLQLYAESNPSSVGMIVCGTIKKIDLANISKIKIDMDLTKTDGNTVLRFQLNTANDDSSTITVVAITTSMNRGVLEIDTSNISQQLYFRVTNHMAKMDYAKTTANIYRVWGES